MALDKLVRDKIPDIIRTRGGTPLTHVADETEFRRRLLEKLREEVEELAAATTVDGVAEETADILEVLGEIVRFDKLSLYVVESIKRKKLAERGGFSHRIILDDA